MDGTMNGSSLEERIRRMALLNGSVPDEHIDTTPIVRLPPRQPMQHPPGMPPFNQTHQRDASWHSGSSSPASPYNQHVFQSPLMSPGYPQPNPHALPPHLQRQGGYPPPPFQGPPPPGPHPIYQNQPPSHAQYPGGGPRGPGMSRGRGMARPQRNQQIQLDPDAFQRGGPVQHNARPAPSSRHLFNPNARHPQPYYQQNINTERQAQYVEQIASREVSNVEMTQAERDEKEAFRKDLEKLCHEVCDANPSLPKVSLECFGSFQSGFASAGSDMDLVIVVQDNTSSAACFSLLEDDLPRELERALLLKGHGARLLTRTRVPIIKVCQDPGSCLLSKLQIEREKWDFLPTEQKYPHLHQGGDGEDDADDRPPTATGTQAEDKITVTATAANGSTTEQVEATATAAVMQKPETEEVISIETTETVKAASKPNAEAQRAMQRRERDKTWTRERKAGPLDFPKDGVGIQCDINFFNPLGLHNTQLLRCYSLCDPRVRPMVLFVKAWAKIRRINSSYSGTLSSYGYVLMVLHYLMNVAQPPVLPNLQLPWRPNPTCTPPGATRTQVDEWVVDFWRNEEEIQAAVQNGQMSTNKESIGSLLTGFFQYYSSIGQGPKFHWMQMVLSLRTQGGILTKEAKGWVKATTEEGEGKKIQHRYLFCIEDPFELTHNVARTVTHNGIVAIRDEFRRASRILHAVGLGCSQNEGELFTPLVEAQDLIDATEALKMTNGGEKAENGNEQRTEKPKTNGQRKQPQQKTLDGTNDRPTSRGGQKSKPSTIDVADQNAFPTLGAASKVPNPRRKKSNAQKEGFASIDGKKAQAHLDEFRRKKAEEQAEYTAMGAAEAVLNGDD